MKKIFILLFISALVLLYPETSKSIGTANAFNSTDSGFDALMFNPAVLPFTQNKFGLSLWGNNYFTIYNNTFSSNDILLMDKQVDITDFIENKLNYMPESGFNFGFKAEGFSTLGYANFSNFRNAAYGTDKIESEYKGKFHDKKKIIIKEFDLKYTAGTIDMTADLVSKIVETESDTTTDIADLSTDINDTTQDKNIAKVIKKEKSILSKYKQIDSVYLQYINSKTEMKKVTLHYKNKKETIEMWDLDKYSNGTYILIPVTDSGLSQVEVEFNDPVYQDELKIYGMRADYKKVKYSNIFDNFAVGFGSRLNTEFSFTLNKHLFNTFFNELSLENTTNFKASLSFKQYFNYFISAGYRLRFIENKLPFITKISVGATQHFYMPVAFFTANGELSVNRGSADPETGIYSYNMTLDGTAVIGASSMMNGILKNISDVGSLNSVKDILTKNSSFGFGLGWDLGYYMEFPYGLSAGFAVTDLGFIVLPSASKASINKNIKLDSSVLGEVGNIFSSSDYSAAPYVFMPDTTLRIGGAIEPIKNLLKFFYLTGGMEFAFSGFDEIDARGYPIFEWSNGVDFGPKIPIKNTVYEVKFPVRMGFCYSTETFVPTTAIGGGIIAGPVAMEFAVSGIEFLVKDWGARSVTLSADFKYQF